MAASGASLFAQLDAEEGAEGAGQHSARSAGPSGSRGGLKRTRAVMPGPTTFEDVFSFAMELLPRLIDRRSSYGKAAAVALTRLCQFTLLINTVYSGMGTPEMAFPFIEKAFLSQGSSFARCTQDSSAILIHGPAKPVFQSGRFVELFRRVAIDS